MDTPPLMTGVILQTTLSFLYPRLSYFLVNHEWRQLCTRQFDPDVYGRSAFVKCCFLDKWETVAVLLQNPDFHSERAFATVGFLLDDQCYPLSRGNPVMGLEEHQRGITPLSVVSPVQACLLGNSRITLEILLSDDRFRAEVYCSSLQGFRTMGCSLRTAIYLRNWDVVTASPLMKSHVAHRTVFRVLTGQICMYLAGENCPCTQDMTTGEQKEGQARIRTKQGTTFYDLRHPRPLSSLDKIRLFNAYFNSHSHIPSFFWMKLFGQLLYSNFSCVACKTDVDPLFWVFLLFVAGKALLCQWWDNCSQLINKAHFFQ